MKLRLSLVLAALAGSVYGQDLKRAEIEFSGPAGASTRIEWTRGGKLPVTQTVPHSSSSSLVIVHSPTSPAANVIIYFTDGRVSGFATKKSGFLISIDDFTKDGIPDFLQIRDPDSEKVIEAFSIVSGLVEPLPPEWYKTDREEFYFDEDLIEYLNQKKKNEPNRVPVTG